MPSYLPSELVATIAILLDPSTLLGFRTASKRYRQASERAFLETFFTTKIHLYTSGSLDRLLKICQSPHLVKCLKSIEILQPDNGTFNEEEWKDWYGPPGDIAWEPWVLDSQAIRENDTTLREILHHLKLRGTTPKLSVRSSAKPGEDRPYGVQAYMRPWKHDSRHEIDDETLIDRHDLCDLASYRLAIAIADSEFPVETLTLEDICKPTLSRCKIENDIQRYSESFFGAVSSMSSLVSIALLFSKDPSDGHDEEPLSAIVRALEPLPLINIRLRHVSGSMKAFVALLAQHVSTLRRISLEDTGIVDKYP